jgi:hypothetical protein
MSAGKMGDNGEKIFRDVFNQRACESFQPLHVDAKLIDQKVMTLDHYSFTSRALISANPQFSPPSSPTRASVRSHGMRNMQAGVLRSQKRRTDGGKKLDRLSAVVKN